jgi:hypothetical protein
MFICIGKVCGLFVSLGTVEIKTIKNAYKKPPITLETASKIFFFFLADQLEGGHWKKIN